MAWPAKETASVDVACPCVLREEGTRKNHNVATDKLQTTLSHPLELNPVLYNTLEQESLFHLLTEPH